MLRKKNLPANDEVYRVGYHYTINLIRRDYNYISNSLYRIGFTTAFCERAVQPHIRVIALGILRKLEIIFDRLRRASDLCAADNATDFKRQLRRWRTEPLSSGNEIRVNACAPTIHEERARK